mgnify:CR=1 FL=1
MTMSIDRALTLSILLVLVAVGCSRSHEPGSPDATAPGVDGGLVLLPDAGALPDAGVLPDAGAPPAVTGRTISAGAFHACALGPGGTVW